MSYSEDLTDTYRRAAGYVDKLLKGTRPGALPVKEANKFEFVVNRRTAKTLNIELPASLLARATGNIA
jgi:putative ABC transport system substrate-binding protein